MRGSVCEGEVFVDKGDESSSPSTLSVMSECRVSWKLRGVFCGFEFGFLDSGYVYVVCV